MSLSSLHLGHGSLETECWVNFHPPQKKKHIYIRNLFKFAEQNMQVKVKVMMKFNERIGGGGDFFCKHGISR